MKKLFALFIVALMVAFAVPVMADPPSSSSGVSGSVTEENGAVIFVSPSFGNASGVSGSQNSAASFKAYSASRNGENATGNASLIGDTVVTATVTGNGVTGVQSTIYGMTENGTNNQTSIANPQNNVSASTDSSGGTVRMKLSGYGTITGGTNAQIGAAYPSGEITNGAFSATTATGAFKYNVSDSSGRYSGWMGGGSTVINGQSTVGTIGNGFSASSSVSVNSIACPVGK